MAKCSSKIGQKSNAISDMLELMAKISNTLKYSSNKPLFNYYAERGS